jgi:hypothetical protein
MESWRHAGRILQGLREGRGWTVPMFVAELEAHARAIGRRLTINRESLVRMVYDWEAGAHRPRDYYTLFILIYATQEELSARTIERGSELDRLMAAFKSMGVSVDRRRFLLNATALAAGVAGVPAVAANLDGRERLSWVLKHPRNVDLPTVAFLRQQALDLLRRNEATPAASLFPVSARQLEQVMVLREHAPAGRVRQELFAVEAQSATLLGRLLWDVSGHRDHATAARYFDQAVDIASNVKDGWAEASPRMFQRFIPVYGTDKDPRKGLVLAERAVARATDGSSRVVAGWSCALAAEAYADLGEERRARLALDRANAQLMRVAADDPLYGVFGREQLGGFIGVCHLRLHHPKGAQAALQQTARSFGVGKEKHKAVILGDLSTAFIGQGEPEQAAVVLHEAIDLVELTRDAGGMKRVFSAGRQLGPWRHEPFVQEVQDRLLALGC